MRQDNYPTSITYVHDHRNVIAKVVIGLWLTMSLASLKAQPQSSSSASPNPQTSLPAQPSTQTTSPITPEQIQALIQQYQQQQADLKKQSAPQIPSLPALSPEDKKMKELQEQQQKLAKQDQLEAFRRRVEFQQWVHDNCVPAPPPKACGFLCRQKEAVLNAVAQEVNKGEGKAATKVAEKTKGDVNPNDLPNLGQAIKDAASQTQHQQTTCPAGYVPRANEQKGSASN